MTNLPDAQQPGAEATETPAGPGGAVGRLSQTRNWEIDKVSQKTTTPPGEVERLSISVLLNDRAERRGNQTVMVTRTPQEIAKLEELVKRTVGFDVERGDSLKVDSAPFMRQDAGEGETGPTLPAWRRYLPYIIAAIILVCFAVVVLVWRKNQAKSRTAEAQAAQAAVRRIAQVRGIGGESGALPPGMTVSALEGEASTGQRSESHLLDAPLRRAKALQVAFEDPATAAIVIRKWLNASTQASASARI